MSFIFCVGNVSELYKPQLINPDVAVTRLAPCCAVYAFLTTVKSVMGETGAGLVSRL